MGGAPWSAPERKFGVKAGSIARVVDVEYGASCVTFDLFGSFVVG